MPPSRIRSRSRATRKTIALAPAPAIVYKESVAWTWIRVFLLWCVLATQCVVFLTVYVLPRVTLVVASYKLLMWMLFT